MGQNIEEEIFSGGQMAGDNRWGGRDYAAYCAEAFGVVPEMRRFVIGVIFFGLVLWGWLVPFAISQLVPKEYFVTDISFTIDDSVVGTPPVVRAERVVVRDFYATFSSQIREDNVTGALIAECSATTEPVKSVAGSPPAKGLTLTTWLGGRECHLDPGTYVVVTDVAIPLGSPLWLGAAVRFPIVSNAFTIWP